MSNLRLSNNQVTIIISNKILKVTMIFRKMSMDFISVTRPYMLIGTHTLTQQYRKYQPSG